MLVRSTSGEDYKALQSVLGSRAQLRQSCLRRCDRSSASAASSAASPASPARGAARHRCRSGVGGADDGRRRSVLFQRGHGRDVVVTTKSASCSLHLGIKGCQSARAVPKGAHAHCPHGHHAHARERWGVWGTRVPCEPHPRGVARVSGAWARRPVGPLGPKKV